MKRYPGILLIWLLIPLCWASAAEGPTINMDLYQIVSGMESEAGTRDWQYALSGTALVSFTSPSSGNVRGDIALDFSFPTEAITLKRAYMRIRFPSFRLTMGKTRLGWGSGALFNSGDVIFGSTDTQVALTDTELRTTTAWLTAVNLPLGTFSFIEAVVLPHQTFALEDTALGGRFYTTVGNLKLEAGCISKVDNGRLYSPYISLQGNIGPDWYLSSSVDLPVSENPLTAAKESLDISFGLFHMVRIGIDQTLSLRLESLIRPFQSWTDQFSALANYGLLFYAEASFVPDNTLTYLLRSEISPIDQSAALMAGVSWKVFQDFSLNSYLVGNIGDSDDLFPWKGQLGAMVGASWVY